MVAERAPPGSPVSSLMVLPSTDGIAVERGGPEAIGEHDSAGGVGPVIVRVEQAAEDGVQAHDVEV